MSDEEKKECKCCECSKVALEFFLRLTAVFLGVLLAIIVASAILKPQPPMPGCPCPRMMGPGPAGIEFPQHRNHWIHKHNNMLPMLKHTPFRDSAAPVNPFENGKK